MTSALLGSSSVRLIGVTVTDIAVVPPVSDDEFVNVAAVSAAGGNVASLDPVSAIDTVTPTNGQLVVLKDQTTAGIRNGLYRAVSRGQGGNARVVFVREPVEGSGFFSAGGGSNVGKRYKFDRKGGKFDEFPGMGSGRRTSRRGANKFLEEQVTFAGAKFAMIYSCVYDGRYFELERPTLFLVHGEDLPFTDDVAQAVAPEEPVLSGIADTDVFLSRKLRYWEYDKADFTVRMDVSAGMIEEVLLGFELGGGDDPMDGGSVGGGRVGGGRVGGGRVGGGRVGGGRVGGGRVGGGRVGGGRVGGGRVGGG